MSRVGIRISKPNRDVKTASDRDLVWSDSFKTFKLYKAFQSTSIQSLEHGLDYPPAFVALWYAGGNWNKATSSYTGGGLPKVSVDNSHVHFLTTDQIYIILFIDPLNE